ncbi:hypothetical protein BST31_17685 [Mycobacterium marseillense]|nr:hypothetical protein BST31_17685 [Mycobacterium marseillense]
MATVGACCRSSGPAGVPRNRAGAHREAERLCGRSRAIYMKTVIVCREGAAQVLPPRIRQPRHCRAAPR